MNQQLTTAEMLRKIANDTAKEKNDLVNRLFASNQKRLDDQIEFHNKLIEANKARGTVSEEVNNGVVKFFNVVAWIDGLAIFGFLCWVLYNGGVHYNG